MQPSAAKKLDPATPASGAIAAGGQSVALPATAPIPSVAAERPEPQWFRANALPGANQISSGMRKGDASGSTGGMRLLELPQGTTVETCVKQVTELLAADVPNLAPAAKADVPGSVKLVGEGDGYRATVVCGDSKGSVRAYLSYEWLR